MNDFVSLNVGGKVYTTTIATLTAYPDSMLGAMFSGRMDTHRDKDGNYLIDRDGDLFQYVLNFLRNGALVLPEGFKRVKMLCREAEFFQIQPMCDELNEFERHLNDPSEVEYIEISVSMNAVDQRDRFDSLIAIGPPDSGPCEWKCLLEKSLLTINGHQDVLRQIPSLMSFPAVKDAPKNDSDPYLKVIFEGRDVTWRFDADPVEVNLRRMWLWVFDEDADDMWYVYDAEPGVAATNNHLKLFSEISKLGFNLHSCTRDSHFLAEKKDQQEDTYYLCGQKQPPRQQKNIHWVFSRK